MSIEQNGEASSPRRSVRSVSDDEDFGMGLDDLLPVSRAFVTNGPKLNVCCYRSLSRL